jgi:putative IMPACT (imprinted ancient) family translation regulator
MTTADVVVPQQPLGELKIADSHFLGFCFPLTSTKKTPAGIQNEFKGLYPNAAHIPVAWYSSSNNNNNNNSPSASTWDEDGEPPNSIGPGMVEEITNFVQKNKNAINDKTKSCDVVVVIVRFFGERLLGVTCGRLRQCYQSIVRLALHRYYFPDQPMEVDYCIDYDKLSNNVYGMGAGDCELILDVIDDDDDDDDDGDGESTLVQKVLSELKFDGFKGAGGEELPRLQNLQADTSSGVIPVYRYPGNYSGDEWVTFEWSPTSLRLKQAVEEKLQPLIHQTMNHCVTNYYRHGKDFIAHHGDKDLDLNRDGVIVSLSLGDERTMELCRRAPPQDVQRIRLPHCSMLVLGPNTNRDWTHSILPKEDSKDIRLSLTMRDVKTFQDLSTGRLYGQGVENKTLNQLRTRQLLENSGYFAAFFVLSGYMVSQKANTTAKGLLTVGAFAGGTIGLKCLSNFWDRKREERAARDFFSKASSTGTKY